MESWRKAKRTFERDWWTRALKEIGCVKKIAVLAGVNRTAAYQILNRLGIPPPVNRTPHRGNWGDLSDRPPKAKAQRTGGQLIARSYVVGGKMRSNRLAVCARPPNSRA